MATIFQDLDISFTSNPSTGDFLKTFDVKSATFALKNVLLTRPGQNFGDFLYGCGLNDLQFELMTPALGAFIKRKIQEQILLYVPEIQVQNLTVATNLDTGDTYIVIMYYVIGNPAVQTFNMTLTKSR